MTQLPHQYEKDLQTRIGFFKEKMDKHLETQRLRSIVGVDVVLIPIINTKHFYLMAFNLKTHQTFVIDNMGTRGSFKFIYKGWPEKMRETFASYLALVDHPDLSKVNTSTLTRVDIPWASKSNHIDYGVFMMRHMETFKGCVTKEWFADCGLSDEVDARGKVIGKQKAELNDLRRKYVAKMLLNEINLTKEDFVQVMMEYDSLSADSKMGLENTTSSRIIERLKLC
ncbi:uncharacterized protein LOC143630996 [Bidens hawaiensis]|uniref:uncharacterized protein LOC143630996 n=1 Tax=Bidens hawaiensis TaxID=980011 RepID=UPI00404A7A7F